MKGLFPLMLSLILFWGVQKFYIKNRGLKEISPNWHWVGLLPLVFGILNYVITIMRFADPWKLQWTSWGLLLWVCPLTGERTAANVAGNNFYCALGDNPSMV